MIIKAGGLLIHKEKCFFISRQNKLQFPKGVVEKGETTLECAKRELSEESGYQDFELLSHDPIISEYNYRTIFGKRVKVKLHLYLFGLKSKKRNINRWRVLERVWSGKWLNLAEAKEKVELKSIKQLLENLDLPKFVNHEEKINILMIPTKYFPSSHAMLENVYVGLLPSKGYRIDWIMKSKDILETKWGLCSVFTFSTTVSLLKIVLVKHYKERYDFIQVRNSLIAGYIAVIATKLFGGSFIFQLSFPHEEARIRAASMGFYKFPSLHIFRSKLEIMIRKDLINRSEKTLVISNRMKKDLIDAGSKDNKLFVFPLGAPSSYLENQYIPPSDKNKTIIYFGSLDRIRNLQFLLRVMKIVVSTIPNAQLELIGSSKRSGDVIDLQRRSDSLNLSKNVTFVGNVPRKDILEHLSLSQLSVCPYYPDYPYLSASPTKLYESLAAGIPVVGTRGIEEINQALKNGVGVLCDYNEESFAEGIIRLLNDPDEAIKMSKLSKEFIIKNRSYELLATIINSLYSSLLANGWQ